MAKAADGLRAGVQRVLEGVSLPPDQAAVDAVMDPGGASAALHALAAGEALLVRAGRPLGVGDETFGPAPREPAWVRVAPGSAELDVLPARAGGSVTRERARRVVVTSDARPCCDAPSCTLEKTLASAWIELDPADNAGKNGPERLLVAERLAPAEGKATEVVTAVAAELARVLGVPLEDAGGRALDPEEAPFADAESRAPLPAVSLARFTLRSEGHQLILRDHASGGPRASSRQLGVVGAVLAFAAAAAWFELARGLAGERSLGTSIGVGATAALLTLAAVAFLGVARFAARYRADSAPLLALARGRFVVRPWVGRTGAVELRPDGRFGAAIPIQELRGVTVGPRGDEIAVELDTEHGPFDVLTTGDARVAEALRDALLAAFEGAAHPGAKVSARQRARERKRAGGKTTEAPAAG